MSLPYILLLETSGKNCSVAISKGDELLCLCEELSENFSHSKQLHTFVNWALEGAEISLQDINAVAVSKGPGSYTGLRIGVSSAKGFAMGLNVPLIGTQTLRSLMQPHFSEDFPLYVSTLKARKNELYFQTFTSEESTSQPEITILDESFLNSFKNKKALVVGSGAEMIKTYIEENSLEGFSDLLFNSDDVVSAKNAIPEAYRKFKNNDFEDLALFEPQYIKSVHVTTSKKNLLQRN